GNAIKFRTKERDIVVTVTGERGDDGMCRITIADNGIGFDEKYLDRMFKPFSRLNPASAFEGSGMGLAICRKIVARHCGELTAHGVLGVGSSFIVVLPEKAAKEGART